MLKCFDYLCPNCGHEEYDVIRPQEERQIPCTHCDVADGPVMMQRAWLSAPNSVIGDDIPGGVEVKHGICNEDGTPRRYYSKSEMRREAERRGLVNHVEHIPARGSDKSKHTVRWV